MRIVSLLPSATEIVCALGARDELRGISHECDFPVGLAAPVLTRSRIGPLPSSGAIDQALRDLVRDALAIYEVDVPALKTARPDVIVTQDLCKVCAVSLDDVNASLARLALRDVNVVTLHPTRLAHVRDDVRRVARALNRAPAGEALAASLDQRLREAGARCRAALGGRRPRVLAVEWLDPVMIAGTWLPELIELAGGEALVTKPGDHAPTLTRDELAELDPDVVLVKPCSFPLAQTLKELPALPRLLPWETWRAVREGQVYVSDGNAFFNRPGPRLVESLEILAACLVRAPGELRHELREAVVRVDAHLAVTAL